MLKGVNRVAIEVSEPESVYFERAIFFVKPQYAACSELKLDKKAQTLLKESDYKPGFTKKDRSKKLLGLVKMGVSALIGGAVTAGAMLMLQL